jgi:hypothetical protein
VALGEDVDLPPTAVGTGIFAADKIANIVQLLAGGTDHEATRF